MDPFKAPKRPPPAGRPPGRPGGQPHGSHLLPSPPTAYKPGAPAPSGRKSHGLLQTINKLEQESEDRVFELIRLRTLVLKLEKEKEDATTVTDELKRENAELQQELSKVSTELHVLKREHNELRCRQWLEGAQGLSTVRVAFSNAQSGPSVMARPGALGPGPAAAAAADADGDAPNSPTTLVVERVPTPDLSLSASVAAHAEVVQQARTPVPRDIDDERAMGAAPRDAPAAPSAAHQLAGPRTSDAGAGGPAPVAAAGATSTSGAEDAPPGTPTAMVPPPPAAAARATADRTALGSSLPQALVSTASWPQAPGPLSPAPHAVIASPARAQLPSLQQQQQQQQMQAEATLMTVQLQDFKDRVSYLQQELNEEKKRRDNSSAARRILEARVAELSACVQRVSNSGSSSSSTVADGRAGTASALTRNGSILPRSPMRLPSNPGGAGEAGAASPAAGGAGLREQRSGLNPATEANLNQLQEFMLNRNTMLGDKQKEVDAWKQECESLKQQLGEAQRVIIEKLAKAPSQEDVTELKAQVTHYRRLSNSRHKQLDEALARITQLSAQLAEQRPSGGRVSGSGSGAEDPAAAAKRWESHAKGAELRACEAEAMLGEADKKLAEAHEKMSDLRYRVKELEEGREREQQQQAARMAVEQQARAGQEDGAERGRPSSAAAAAGTEGGMLQQQARLQAQLQEAEVRADAAQARLRDAEARLAPASGSRKSAGDGSSRGDDARAGTPPEAAAVAESRSGSTADAEALYAAAPVLLAAVPEDRTSSAVGARGLQEAGVLSSALQEQTARLADASGRADAAESRLAAAESRVASLEQDAASKGAFLEQLQHLVATLTAERDEAAGRAADARLRVLELESQQAGSTAKAVELQRQVEQARNEATEAGLAMAQRLAEREGALAERAQDLEARGLELAAVSAARDEAAAAASRLERELEREREGGAALAARLAELDVRVVELEGAASRAAGEAEGARAQAAELTTQLEAAGRRAAELQAKVDGMAASYEKQVAAMAEHDLAVAELHERTQELQAQLDVACAEKERLASEVGRLEPEVEAARKLLGQREADLASARHDLESTRTDRDAKAEQLAGREAEAAVLARDLEAVEPTLQGLRACLRQADARVEALEARAEAGEAHALKLQRELSEAMAYGAGLKAKLDAAERSLSQLSDTVATTDQEVYTLRAEGEQARAEADELGSKNFRMQGLIKDMAAQMEVLQGNLARQTALVAKLEAALNSQGNVAAEVDEMNRSQSLMLRERADNAERKLTSARIKLNEQGKEFSRLSNGNPPVMASTKAEVQTLFKKLKAVAQMYKLTLATSLSKQLRAESSGSNVTELQLFQLLHAVLAALEATSPSPVSSQQQAPPVPAPLPLPLPRAASPPMPEILLSASLKATNSSGGGLPSLTPLPPSYDMRAALAGTSFVSQASSASSPGAVSGGGVPLVPIGRTSSFGSGRPLSTGVSSSATAPGTFNPRSVGGAANAGPSSGGSNGNGVGVYGTYNAHGGMNVRSMHEPSTSDGPSMRGGRPSRIMTETGSTAVQPQHSRGPSMADSVMEELIMQHGGGAGNGGGGHHDVYESSDTLPDLGFGLRGAGGGDGSRPGSSHSQQGRGGTQVLSLNLSRRASEMGAPLSSIPSVPHLPPLSARPVLAAAGMAST